MPLCSNFSEGGGVGSDGDLGKGRRDEGKTLWRRKRNLGKKKQDLHSGNDPPGLSFKRLATQRKWKNKPEREEVRWFEMGEETRGRLHRGPSDWQYKKELENVENL